MKIYKVKVNGKVYEVELESVTEKKGVIATPVANDAPVGKDAKEILTPMAGNILEIKVAVGEKVEKGQVVAILEAMKLENEVVANESGVVKKVLVAKGQSVQSKEAIIIVG